METSTLDFVAQACMDLTEAMSSVSTDAEREALVSNHINKVWSSVTPIDDFKRNLEWVNVSEAISLAYHCLDKVVVMDFWTYCCINCYHVLPDLADLEKLHKVEDGLVVLGVHCAKFTNEKETSNILSAVQRYDIHHPVVNDAESVMWEAIGIHCWPTLLILGPGNKPIFVLTGEGHRDELVLYAGAALRHFAGRLSTAALPVAPAARLLPKADGILRFPGKLAINPYYRGRPDEPFLAISDSGHHRVLLVDCSGAVLTVVGGERGFKDGKLGTAQFDSPQGLCWLSGAVLAVCDSANHALRAIHLDEGAVDTLAGNGTQAAFGDNGGRCLGLQPLSSPWDVVLFRTPDMDMTVRPPPPPPPPPPPASTAPPAPPAPPAADAPAEKAAPETAAGSAEAAAAADGVRRVLLIANAGAHQLWALFLDTTIWWKYKTYTEGTCVCIAGSGAEAARNSAYPASAAFAQPSGLALRLGSSPEVFVADAESSSIRRLALTAGQVATLCGGDRNPLNLFAFGDADDAGVDAKFQHPLAVAVSEFARALFVADTYNHKIRRVDLATNRVATLNPTMIETADPVKFNEPSGLSLSVDGRYLYVADTNNHSVKVYNLAKNACQEMRVRMSEPKFVEPDNLILYKNDLFVNKKFGSLIIYFNVSLDSNSETKNVKFTPDALQHWRVCVRDDANNDVTLEEFEFVNCSHKGVKLPGKVEMKLKNRTDKTHYRLYLSFKTALCDASVCFMHTFTVRSNMLVRESVKMVESYKITCKVNPVNRSLVHENKADQSQVVDNRS